MSQIEKKVSDTESEESEVEPIDDNDSDYKYAGRRTPTINKSATLVNDQMSLLPPGFGKALDES